MKLCILWFFTLAISCLADTNTVAARLVRQAHKLENSGQIVRAYLLLAEAAAREPQNPTYRANRDALAPAAKLLMQAKVEPAADISSDIQTAEEEAAHPEPPIQRLSPDEIEAAHALAPLPQVQARTGTQDFDLRADAKSLATQVSAAYGVHVLINADVKAESPIHFELQGADFRSALEAVTAATHTFVFPVSSKTLYFAPDTEAKRDELEPTIVLTFRLQEALTEKDLIEAINAVRGLLKLRTIGWDSYNRTVLIRDRATRARVARGILESLLLPRAQFSLEVEFLAADTDRNYQYGLNLQNVFQFIDFGRVGGFQSLLPAAVGPTQFLTFGGGATLFGVGVAEATAFATYTNSASRSLYDATVAVGDRQTVNFHIGDKYPIPTSLYTGFSAGTSSIYNPAPQITLEDLGLILKIVPHVNGGGEIVLDVEADYKALGSLVINSVPSVAERAFKGTVNLREGQWAILAGMDASSKSTTRSGVAGLGRIPGLSEVFNQTTRDTQTSNTLLVIKPTLTRLPVTDTISPQFLLGPTLGERVII